VNPLKSLNNCPDTLAMDIGTGTKDILHFQGQNTLENNLKLVVPTPASIMAEHLENHTGDLAIAGYTMGGGYLAKVLRKHAAKKSRVRMEKLPAFTIRNNIEEITDAGIEIIDKVDDPTHIFDEIELPFLFDLLNRFGKKTGDIKVIGLSVQDHGFNNSDESSRKNRFKYFLEHLRKDLSPKSLVFTAPDLPKVFGRLGSGALCVSHFDPSLKIVLIDTSFSAILGCLLDSRVAAISGPVLYINFGNGHVMACVLCEGKIQAFYEHHTRVLKTKPSTIRTSMERLVEGKISSDEVFDDEGNGCMTFQPQPFRDLAGIVVTGPQRYLAEASGLGNYMEAAPGGDMMMTGPLGLLRGLSLRLDEMEF